MSLSILIITGQSGSGKSTAMRALEDEDYFCIDNLPARLVEELLEMRENTKPNRIALAMDIRDPTFIESFPPTLERLRDSNHSVRVVYLEAAEETLVRRFSETRRKHPLKGTIGLRDAIRKEARILAPLRELADHTIDTSGLTPHKLKEVTRSQLAESTEAQKMRLAIMSFGFKHGLPSTADLVFDVRFLPNPYFTPHLREKTGLDEEVFSYVLEQPQSSGFIKHAIDMLTFLLPQYEAEGKRYLTIGIGCTGGQHRSVSIARKLTALLEENDQIVALSHRDIEE